MNSNLPFILRHHHPWRASTKHVGIIRKFWIAEFLIARSFVPSPVHKYLHLTKPLPSLQKSFMDDPYSAILVNNRGLYTLYEINQTASNLGYYLQIMTNSQATADLKKCKIKNMSCLFRPLAQCLESEKQCVLSTGITNMWWLINTIMHGQWETW